MTDMKKRYEHLAPTLILITALSPSIAAEYRVNEFLPLAVGNSWLCYHEVEDWFHILPGNSSGPYGESPGDWPAWRDNKSFMLTVEHTEEIDGKTYFVMSDMPSGWPPAPQGFISGKKLRWERTRLMEHANTGELVYHDFGNYGPDEIFEWEDTVTDGYHVPVDGFYLPADDLREKLEAKKQTEDEPPGPRSQISHEIRSTTFLHGWGLWECREEVSVYDPDDPDQESTYSNSTASFSSSEVSSPVWKGFENRIAVVKASLIEGIGEDRVVNTMGTYEGRHGLRGTVTSFSSSVTPLSWGQVKNWVYPGFSTPKREMY